MALFDRNSIIGSEYDWFKDKLDPSFSIDDGPESKVIFGYNGIGKTTIFKCLKELNNSLVDFLDYDEVKDSVKKQKTNLTIATNITQIEEIKTEIDNLKTSVDLKKIINEKIGITNATTAKKFGSRIQEVQKDGTFDGFKKTQSEIGEVENLVGDISPKVFFEIQEELSSVVDAKDELEKEKKRLLFAALENINETLDSNDNVCPVCNSHIADIKQVVQDKMNSLSKVKSDLILKLKKSNYSVDSNKIKELAEAYELVSNDDDLKAEYIVCGGLSSNYPDITNNHNKITKSKSQLSVLLEQAEDSFRNVQKVIDFLKSDLEKYFHVEPKNVKTDSENYSFSIKFPRETKTYSTGELNLICFLFKMYSFIGSDKTTMIFDDPVSSLDFINHYKIAYEIVKNAKPKKTMVVLTHSVELINSINSQHKGFFKFYYLEERKGTLSIQEISKSYTIKENPNIITLDNLPEISQFNGLIEALKRRETKSQRDGNSLYKLFHYTVEAQHLDNDFSKFSNHSLINLIDSFKGFSGSDFFTNSAEKIIHLVALRVWLEKKLYDLIPSESKDLKDEFLSTDSLGGKINLLLPLDKLPLISTQSGLSRDALMSKKVMLNQNMHYDSQIMPFAYAINLSFDMIEEEIGEFKKLLP
ncbi:MAG TPA: hypothetical protein GX010_03715 [Erysipelotrichaceae bacterium]|nr:hypothetical protein [Erysipelotrichaceae bacterium]